MLVSGSTERFFLFDALGSTDRLLAVNQSVTDQYLYEAFGKEVLKTGTTRNPFRWLGQIGYYTDNETTGVPVYVRARQYSPVQGRWLSVDPVQFRGGLNFYAYVTNSLLRLSDASGLACTVRLKCTLTSSQLNGCNRDCSYSCQEVSRVDSAGGTVTCADLPNTPIMGYPESKQETSWLCIFTGGKCGTPPACPNPINSTKVFINSFLDFGDCSKAACRADCDRVLDLAKKAAQLLKNKTARDAAIAAAEAAAVVCRDGCNAYCKKP